MTNPYFSVIIPTYNRATFISKTIESVLNQTFDDFELLIIDDGSTDNTREIINEYKDSRIRYIYQDNKERGSARNNGIHNSMGTYITFLDSDDLFMYIHLETVYSNLKNNKFPVLFHQDYKILDLNGNEKMFKHHKVVNPIKELLTVGNYLGCVGLFVHESIKENVLFDEDRILSGAEDYDYLIRMLMRYVLVSGYEKTSIVINHSERGELIVSKDRLIERTHFFIDKMLKDNEFILKYKKWVKCFISINYSLVALYLSNQKDKKIAIKYLIKSIQSNFLSLFSKRMLVILYSLIFR